MLERSELTEMKRRIEDEHNINRATIISEAQHAAEEIKMAQQRVEYQNLAGRMRLEHDSEVVRRLMHYARSLY